MARSQTVDDYKECCKDCKELFPNEPALSTCIEGCSKITKGTVQGVFLDELNQLQAEVGKLGRVEFLRKIRSAAKKANSNLPDIDEIEKLDTVSRRYIERITNLIEVGAKLSGRDDNELARYAQEVAWAKLATDVAVSFMAMDNSGGGGSGGPTCVTKCADEYDQCVSENHCDTSGWVCFCCMPCSLQYMGCVARCSVVRGGFGGIIIA